MTAAKHTAAKLWAQVAVLAAQGAALTAPRA